jgi:hypothetical protein
MALRRTIDVIWKGRSIYPANYLLRATSTSFLLRYVEITEEHLYLMLTIVQYIVSLVAISSGDSDSVTISSLPHNGRARPSTSSPKPTSGSAHVILSCPIKIATFHVHGPLPTPFTIRPRREDRNQSSLTRKTSKSDIQESDLFVAYAPSVSIHRR